MCVFWWRCARFTGEREGKRTHMPPISFARSVVTRVPATQYSLPASRFGSGEFFEIILADLTFTPLNQTIKKPKSPGFPS